ncbi:MAG: hypothetical protein IKJ26_12265 [Clostridia bacterium]|nr:hypothetical protein [Clostridia bacterium]
MKNKGKIILIVLGAVLIALGGKGLMDIPAQKAILENAVYLDEPVVLPENEGKLVIIHGKPEMTAPAYDEELGITLNTIKAYRYDEEYKQTSREKGVFKYGWVSRGQKGIAGEASVGEFALDEKTINGLAADSEYEDFDMAEIVAKGYVVGRGKTKEGAWTDRWWVIVDGTYYYDSFEYSNDLSIPHITREMDRDIAQEREGAKAYAYKVYTGLPSEKVTVAGIQQGTSLAADETLGAVVRNGVLSKEEVLSSNTSSLMGGSIALILIGVVLGILGLRKPKAKAKEA